MSREEEKRLLKRSKDFLETAEYQIGRGFYDLAAFSLEQTLQLFLKAKLLAEGIEYPRTHSVRALLELLLAVVDEDKKAVIRGVLENYLMELSVLEDAYITSRCLMRDFSRQEVERLAKAVREIMKYVS